jgi:yecA family protein
MPLVLGEGAPPFDTQEEAQGILGELMQLYNEINACAAARSGELPQECEFRDDMLANFDDDAPISRWARGFLCGHQWLEECWDELVPEELEDELASASLVLSFFASNQLAEACVAEMREPGSSLEDTAKTMYELRRAALHEYANIGRSIHEAMAKVGSDAEPVGAVHKIGRNVPCPCGSGKKFKRCHGRDASAG